jgi:molybdopterin-guanine dinucleotide biosynthesis protein A
MRLAGVLLAGGESRRMGRDKATLALDGVPLWRRQLDLLRGIAAEVYVSARRAPGWLPAEAGFVADPAPARGPLGGVAATLAAMRGTHLLALPVDMPAMSEEHLERLWRTAEPGCGAVAGVGDFVEPLPAIYPVEALAFATELLTGEDVSLGGLALALLAAGRMKKQTISPADARLYENCNSPADWQTHAAQTQPCHD